MAEWQCKQCKQYNPDEEESCDQCLAPRVSSGPRETCRTCLHRHSTGKSCHVFIADKKSRERKAKKWNKHRAQWVGGVKDAMEGERTTPSSSLGSLSSRSSLDSGANSGQGSDNGSDTEEEDDQQNAASSDENSEETSGSEESDEEGKPKEKKGLLGGLGDKLAAKAAAIAKTAGQALQSVKRGKRPPQHETPPWAKEASLTRCNCGHGVPTNSSAFSSLQEGRTVQHSAVGMVTVRTEPPVREDLEFENRRPLGSMPPPPHALRLFLEYVDSRTVANCARVSTEWHRECYDRDEEGAPVHPAYAGLHFMEIESSLDACQDKIDGLFFHQPPTGSSGQLFTSGQRSVTAWRRTETEVFADRRDGSTSSKGGGSQSSYDATKTERRSKEARKGVSWVTAGVAVRDTAPFTTIRPVNNSIMCCSSNGSIREWSLAHEMKNTRLLAQMWEHNGYVTDVAFTAPSVGYCKAHGAPAHSCYMYSVSDDRYLKVSDKVWDLATKECLHTVKPEVSNCGTLQSVVKSDFHLYAGSSNGRIVVYALERVCQRPEKHRCHLQDEPHWFCEQSLLLRAYDTYQQLGSMVYRGLPSIGFVAWPSFDETFQHGTEPVQHMVCGGVGGSSKYLFTGARDGSIQVWNVPKASFGHTKVCLFRQHKRAITALSLTKAHLFSASDEGHLRIWNLATLSLQRVVKQERRIKCIWVHHAPRESPDAGKGSVFLGLATGLVLAYPITDAV